MNHSIDLVRAYEVTPDHSVTPDRRVPYRGLSQSAIEVAEQLAITLPELQGPLFALLRKAAGVPEIDGWSMTLEAHLNADHLSSADLDRLIRLGFDADDFLTLSPVMYTRNLTLRLRMDHSDSRRRRWLESFFGTSISGAVSYVARSAACSEAFIETEKFSSKRVKTFELQPGSALVELDDPFQALDVVELPCDEAEATMRGIDLTGRFADERGVGV